MMSRILTHFALALATLTIRMIAPYNLLVFFTVSIAFALFG
jgi:hypothetical protein